MKSSIRSVLVTWRVPHSCWLTMCDVSVIPALFKVNDKRLCTKPGLGFGLNFAGEFDYVLTYNCSFVSNKADNYLH